MSHIRKKRTDMKGYFTMIPTVVRYCKENVLHCENCPMFERGKEICIVADNIPANWDEYEIWNRIYSYRMRLENKLAKERRKNLKVKPVKDR